LEKLDSLSVIIPLYNEQDNVPRLLDELTACMDRLEARGVACRAVLVDDASTDATGALIEACVDERVEVLTHEKNCGKGRSLRDGAALSRGGMVFFTDADLAYGFEPLCSFIDVMRAEGCRAVIGSRLLSPDGYGSYTPARRLMSWGFRMVQRLVLGLPYGDTQCGFKLFEGELARSAFAKCRSDRFGIDFELLSVIRRSGAVIKEMPVRVVRHGKSSVRPVRDTCAMLGELFGVRKRLGAVQAQRRDDEEQG